MSTELTVKPNKAVELSLGKLIFLHLLPGVLIAIVYALIARTVSAHGYPKVVAIGIAAMLVMIPAELGIILYYSKRIHGTYSIGKMIQYREKLSWKEYFIFVPILFMWFAIIFAATKSLSAFIFDKAFYWLPNWYLLTENFESFSKGALTAAFLTCFFITGLIAPIIEEIYFRGFLLPRMSWMGKYAPLVNSILFSVYHFWSPWVIVTRTLAILPMAYVVQLRKNIYIGIIVHCMLNVLGDAVGMLVLLLK